MITEWMGRFLSVSGMLLVVALTGCENSPPKADAVRTPESTCGSRVISGAGIGELRIGMTLDSARLRCQLGADTTILGAEGMKQRQAYAKYENDSVRVEIVDNRVWRLSVLSPDFATADSLRVGTKVSAMPGYPDLRVGFGEGTFFVFADRHCGASFQIDTASVSRAMRADSRVSQLVTRLPADAKVSRILVTGCP